MDEKPINLDADIRERLVPIAQELKTRLDTGLDDDFAIKLALEDAIRGGVRIGIAAISSHPQALKCPACGNVGTFTSSSIVWDNQDGPEVDHWFERFGDDTGGEGGR